MKKPDESFGRDGSKPFDETMDEDFAMAALKQTKKARKNNLNLVQRQKLAKKRIKTNLWVFFLKRICLNYIFIFHAVMNSNAEDMSKVLLTVNHTELIAEAKHFLTEAHMYLKPQKLVNVQEDWNALFAIYKQYIFTFAMSKVQEIGSRASKHVKDRADQNKQKQAFKNQDDVEFNDNVWESDQSDYSLEDFSDLIGTYVEETHVREFFDKEMKKIENDKHRVERVCALKEVVQNFYQLKGEKSSFLMNELDLMAADRDNTMTVKRQGISHVEDIKKD